MNGDDGAPCGAAPQEEEGDHEQETDDMSLLREQLEEALREKDQFRAMAQRSQADLANYKRRALDEMEELRRASNSRLLLKILSIADDLDRALSHIPEGDVASDWTDGLNLILRNIESILDSEGVTRIEADGQEFEPREFEAVSYEESQVAEEGKVIKVLRDGYKHYDKLLRAAQVIVAKSPEPPDQPEAKEESE
jgi:molecular chaperone GrpE